MQTKYIYIIRDGSGACKIGITDNPKQRLNELQIGSSVKLRIYNLIPVQAGKARRFESKIHRLLKNRRLQGEWFFVDPKIALEAILAVVMDVRNLDEIKVPKVPSGQIGTKVICPNCNHWRVVRIAKRDLWNKKLRCQKCSYLIEGKRLLVKVA